MSQAIHPTAISIRQGFATNSSSSHSIVFASDPASFIGFSSNFSDFGWDWFLQSTRKEKLSYIYQAFGQHYELDELAESLSVSVSELEEVAVEGYIDHDSHGLLGLDMAKMLLNSEHLAILGGNDNDDAPKWTQRFTQIDSDEVRKVSDLYETFLSSGENRKVIVEDNKFYAIEKGVVTLFHVYSGIKVRYNMKDNREVYLSVPELVDIKITDFCTYGCDYCYQDSTPEGLHGDTKSILAMIRYMKKMGVFELAIGGGEPTLHPDFMKIIRESAKEDKHGFFIKPNFTTRNMTFFKNNLKRTTEVFDLIGGFAFSVDGPDDVKRLETVFMSWIKKLKHKFVTLTTAMKAFQESHDVDGLKTMLIKEQKSQQIRDMIHIIQSLLDKTSYQIVLGSMEESKYIETLNAIQSSIERMRKAGVELAENESAIFGRLFSTLKYMSNTEIEQKFKEALKSIYIPNVYSFSFESKIPTVMLLGYKDTGRGTSPVYDYSDTAIMQTLSIRNRLFDIGIDTAAAIQMKSSLDNADVSPEMYYVKEGVASCYVDAVAVTMASSSYGSEVASDTMDSYDEANFLMNFSRYQQKGLNAIPILSIS